MEASAGLRERKKQRTRDDLAAAAFALAVDRGLSGFTIDDVAVAADVSPRTFFNYFAGKEEAVVAYGDGRHALFAAALDARPADEAPLAALRAAIVDSVRQSSREAIREQLALLRLLRETPTLLPSLMCGYAATEQLIAQAVAQHSGTDPLRDAYPRLVAACAMAAVRTCLVRWEQEPGGTAASLADAIDEAFAAIGNGLPDPRGR
ncbi:TetR family transcriptional regulator [Angustibacter sp. McL0619]|uniref:acyl-CoA-like ligand-binding transcription factor n=1 Tax=Angustibacter sp. McL0619 TaxID=3415676 RepID=UPI003CFB6CF6